MNPEFSKAIDIIVDFWKSFSDCEIREFYNYCKHKGKPIYKEAESYMGQKKISITLDDPESENKLEIPNATSDVRISYSICDMVKKLKYFDEYCLYPYLLKLLNELECIIKPNPLVL